VEERSTWQGRLPGLVVVVGVWREQFGAASQGDGGVAKENGGKHLGIWIELNGVIVRQDKVCEIICSNCGQ
jgi:hypothetical protein